MRFWICDFVFWIARCAFDCRRDIATNPKFVFAFFAVALLTLPASANEFLLVRRAAGSQAASGGTVQPIRLAAINEQFVEHLPQDRSWERVPLNLCIALLNPKSATPQHRTAGMLAMADGQRLPGEAAHGASTAAETLAWNHPWLGRIDVPLKDIESVVFSQSATAPAQRQSDVVLLTNGDVQEGLITALGDVIVLEMARGSAPPQLVEIPLNLVAGITMIATRQPPAAGTRRIWFDEGTVIDVQSIAVGDDGFVQLGGSPLIEGTQPTRIGLSQITAILLDSNGMSALATLPPTRIEGPVTRYTLPKPMMVNPVAPLGLSAIEYSGPIVARYALPLGARGLIAEAELPREARQWGDCELIVRSNDSEVFRARLNAANPTASINIALPGRELTIELTQGSNGPIQDRVILHRPMLMMGSES